MKIIGLVLFWVLWYLAFSTRSIIISPFLPLIEDALGINHATAGGLFMFPAVGGTLALSATGFLSLLIGYKRLIALGFAVATVSSAGLYYAVSYAQFAAILFFLGLGGGFYLPCAVPIITSMFERKNWGKAISFHETAAGFCILSVPILAALALSHMPWHNVFIVLSGVFAMVTVIFWILIPDTRAQRTKSAELAVIIKRTDFWVITGLWATSSMAALGIYNIVPLFLVDEKGVSVALANQILGVSRIGGFLGQIGVGFFLDRCDTKKLLLYLTLLSGASAIGLAVVKPLWMLVSMLFLQATFCVVFFPVGIVAISKLTRPEERSTYTGAIMAISGVFGIGFTPWFLGTVADVWNFQAGIFVVAVITLCACIPLIWLRKI